MLLTNALHVSYKHIIEYGTFYVRRSSNLMSVNPLQFQERALRLLYYPPHFFDFVDLGFIGVSDISDSLSIFSSRSASSRSGTSSNCSRTVTPSSMSVPFFTCLVTIYDNGVRSSPLRLFYSSLPLLVCLYAGGARGSVGCGFSCTVTLLGTALLVVGACV